MDSILLLIALTAGGAVALLTFQLHGQLTYHRRIVSARIVPDAAGLRFAPESVLRTRGSHIGFLSLLPLSPAAGERMSLELARAGWPIRVREYLALRLGCAAAGGVVAVFILSRAIDEPVLRAFGTVALVIAGWLLPRTYLSRRRQARLQRIEEQLPDALTAIAKSLRAGTGLLQALAYAANETPAPLGDELRSTLRDLQLGAEAEEVFGDLAARVGSRDLDIAVTAIVIQRTVGGNLSEILSNVTNTIRERAKLHREVRVLTTRQRVTSNMVAAVPVAIALLFIMLNPKMFELLTQTTPGRIALAIGITFELFGIWLIRRFAVIEV